MQDGNNFDGDSDKFDWDTEDELEIGNIPLSCSSLTFPGGVAAMGSGEVCDFFANIF